MIDLAPFKSALFILAVSLARMTACFTVLPFMGGKMLPAYVRNALLLTFVFILYPFLAPVVPADLNLLTVAIVVFKEILLGLILGFMVSILFWTAEIVGFLIDNQRGATMAMVFDPLYGHQTSPLGTFLLQIVTILFFVSGGFLVFLEGLFESYRFWPVFDTTPRLSGGFPVFFLSQVDGLMRSAFLLASPILIAVFLTEFCLGLMNRFVPQMNVFFLSMPVKSGVASFLIILYLMVLVYFFTESFAELPDLFGTLEGLMR